MISLVVKSAGNSLCLAKFLAQLLVAGGNKFVVQVAEILGGEHEELCWHQNLWLCCAGCNVYCTCFF
jgi:hypothetical protein